jgi:hypothetical protein
VRQKFTKLQLALVSRKGPARQRPKIEPVNMKLYYIHHTSQICHPFITVFSNQKKKKVDQIAEANAFLADQQISTKND